MLTWFSAVWNSIEKLSSVITFANWGIAATLLVTFVFTAIVIKAGNRRDALLNASDLEKEERISNANILAGEANERAGKLEKEAAELTENNLRLEAAISPRRLSERQQKLLASLVTFAGKAVEIKSYSADTEGLVLATQISQALAKSKLNIVDNRLTMQPAGSVLFGVTVDGSDQALVVEVRRILALDGDLTTWSSVTSHEGISVRVGFGAVSTSRPTAAVVTVGAKPMK